MKNNNQEKLYAVDANNLTLEDLAKIKIPEKYLCCVCAFFIDKNNREVQVNYIPRGIRSYRPKEDCLKLIIHENRPCFYVDLDGSTAEESLQVASEAENFIAEITGGKVNKRYCGTISQRKLLSHLEIASVLQFLQKKDFFKEFGFMWATYDYVPESVATKSGLPNEKIRLDK